MMPNYWLTEASLAACVSGELTEQLLIRLEYVFPFYFLYLLTVLHCFRAIVHQIRIFCCISYRHSVYISVLLKAKGA